MINKNGKDNKYDTENVNDKQKSVDNEYDTDVNFYMLINHLLKKNLKTLGRGGGGGYTPEHPLPPKYATSHDFSY